ncbi:MAG: hypothetical protein AABZ61_01125, partial [Bacteroidota bacterium]
SQAPVSKIADDKSQASELAKAFSTYYARAYEVVIQQMNEITQAILGQDASWDGNIFYLLVVILLVLAVFDRFVLQQFLRMKS